MSDSSDRMLLLLQELAAMDSGELKLAGAQKRREEISRKLRNLRSEKKRAMGPSHVRSIVPSSSLAKREPACVKLNHSDSRPSIMARR